MAGPRKKIFYSRALVEGPTLMITTFKKWGGLFSCGGFCKGKWVVSMKAGPHVFYEVVLVKRCS
jgi:hypothetical protein